jgi:hypothetical protein
MSRIELVKDFADCGLRDNLTEEQRQSLESAREAVAAALLRLADVYQELPEIRNGDNTFDMKTAFGSDVDRLHNSAVNVCLRTRSSCRHP